MSEQKKLFWNRLYPEFTFMDLKGTNPIGQWQVFSAAADTIANPANFGAIYDIQDISPAQALANFEAIKRAIASLPDSGGGLFITGHLQYVGTIENPRRVFAPQVDPRPIPFSILGTPTAALIQLQPGLAAISLQGGFSYQVGSTSAPVTLGTLQVYSKGKGIVIRDGGKETIMSCVIISGCEDTALDIDRFDGGRLSYVYCIANKKDGARINACHMATIMLTTRNNAGVGVTITSSAAHNMWLYTESNRGLGLVFDGYKNNVITLWEENNNGSSYGVQGKVTNSIGNTYIGMAQHEANRAFDIDDYSACTSTFNGKILRDLPAPIDLAWPPIEANIRGPFNNDHLYTPVCSVVGSTVEIAVPVGWYTKQNANITANWIELYGHGWYPPLKMNLVAGNSIMATVRFKADSAMAAYFAEHTTTDTVKVILQGSTGMLGGDGQSVNLRRSGQEFEVQICAPVVKTGEDTIRLFLYICPSIMGDAANLQPSVPHVLTVTAMQFFSLRG